MKNTLYDHGYGETWTDVYVDRRERYQTSVTDFHEHDFYEIHLILTGNVRAFVANRAVGGTGSKLVLAKPNVPHFVSCESDALYSSTYLVFTENFIKSYDVQCMALLSVFGEAGTALEITPEQTALCAELIGKIETENDRLRQKLMVFCLLSHVEEISKQHHGYVAKVPEPVCEAIAYIDTHFAEKIVAQELADKIHVGRTNLMMQFKEYTGKTLHEYLVSCRLRNVVKLLAEGKSEYEAAVSSGFGDTSALIQCFKRVFNMTPGRYIRRDKES